MIEKGPLGSNSHIARGPVVLICAPNLMCSQLLVIAGVWRHRVHPLALRMCGHPQNTAKPSMHDIYAHTWPSWGCVSMRAANSTGGGRNPQPMLGEHPPTTGGQPQGNQSFDLQSPRHQLSELLLGLYLWPNFILQGKEREGRQQQKIGTQFYGHRLLALLQSEALKCKAAFAPPSPNHSLGWGVK